MFLVAGPGHQALCHTSIIHRNNTKRYDSSHFTDGAEKLVEGEGPLYHHGRLCARRGQRHFLPKRPRRNVQPFLPLRQLSAASGLFFFFFGAGKLRILAYDVLFKTTSTGSFSLLSKVSIYSFFFNLCMKFGSGLVSLPPGFFLILLDCKEKPTRHR